MRKPESGSQFCSGFPGSAGDCASRAAGISVFFEVWGFKSGAVQGCAFDPRYQAVQSLSEALVQRTKVVISAEILSFRGSTIRLPLSSQSEWRWKVLSFEDH